MPRDGSFPGRRFMNATLRDPATHKPSGLVFARSFFEAGVVASPHFHLNDTLRILATGKMRFTTFKNDKVTPDEVFEAGPGDIVIMPAMTTYSEEILEPTTVVSSRYDKFLHYTNGLDDGLLM